MFCSYLAIKSLDDPSDHPAFKGGSEKRLNQVQTLTTGVTEMARVMTSGVTPLPAANGTVIPTTTVAEISAGKIANLQSNYLSNKFSAS